jgi:uncharacterized protein
MKLIMKRSFTAAAILFLLATVSFAQTNFPQSQGFVNDFASKLSPATKQQLETLLSNFRTRSGIEMSVVTVNFDDMQGYPIEDYALNLGRQWGIGRSSTAPAWLLLVAIKPPGNDGLYNGGTRLEVSRHLEGDLPDGLVGEIIRKSRDDFRNGRFDQALTTSTQTIVATLAQKRGISMEGIDSSQAYRAPAQKPRSGKRGISPFAIVVIVFIFLAIVHALGNKGGRGGPGGRNRRGGSGLEWLLLPIIFGSGRGGGWGGGSSDSGWGSSGGGGGGDGGGFGGFGGGGDFGGGGASDSW